MTKPFQLPKGVQIADLSGIREAYSISKTEDGYYALRINVSAERIEPVFARLASEVKPPAFLLLETGSHRDVEKELRKNDTDPLHKDVYYLDGQTWADAKPKLAAYTHLLTHDGGINFGFGSHEGHDEVFVGPYKIFSIYADEPAKYETALHELGFVKVEHLRTVWEHFSQSSPGRRNVLVDSKPTIWEMVEALKGQGMYLAERRED